MNKIEPKKEENPKVIKSPHIKEKIVINSSTSNENIKVPPYLKNKSYGIIEEKEYIKISGGKTYKVIEATFLNKGEIRRIKHSIDLTEVINKTKVNPKEIEVVLIITDEKGVVCYLSQQFDKNVEKWAKENKIENYFLRKDIIGKYNILSYIKGKEKEEMKQIIRKTSSGVMCLKESAIKKKDFYSSQCKSKNMLHVINTFFKEDGLFQQVSINLTPATLRIWEKEEQFNMIKTKKRKIKTRKNISIHYLEYLIGNIPKGKNLEELIRRKMEEMRFSYAKSLITAINLLPTEKTKSIALSLIEKSPIKGRFKESSFIINPTLNNITITKENKIIYLFQALTKVKGEEAELLISEINKLKEHQFEYFLSKLEELSSIIKEENQKELLELTLSIVECESKMMN